MLRTLASRWNKQKFRCYEAKIEESEKACFARICHRLFICGGGGGGGGMDIKWNSPIHPFCFAKSASPCLPLRALLLRALPLAGMKALVAAKQQ